MAFLFLLLAFGWTINKQNLATDELDILIPIGCFVVIMHVIVGAIIFVDNHEHHKYHDYQGIQGIMLGLFRFMMWLGFIYGMRQTRKEVKDVKQIKYLQSLTISGSLYILSLPIFLYLCNYLQPYS